MSAASDQPPPFPLSASERIAWVHNFATHYTVRLFELVAERLPIQFLFYSLGSERFWLSEHGTWRGSFPHLYLRGIDVLGTRVTPSLIYRLLFGNYGAIVKCVNGKFALPITYAVARMKRRPFVLYTGIWMRIDTLLHRIAFPLLRHIYKHADALVVYGTHVQRYLIDEGVTPERIFVEPHSVDNRVYGRAVGRREIESVFNMLRVPVGTPLILYVGRFEASKGLAYLIQAFRDLADASAILVLAGTGSERRALETMVKQLRIGDRVRFPGYLPPEQTVRFYAASTVYVLPSITTRREKEPWGLVVNEAFNQGVPVIASSAVGAAAGGLIEDGVNGFVVPEADASALRRALKTVLSNPSLRRLMSDAARRKIAGWDQERAADLIARAIQYAMRRSTCASTTVRYGPHSFESAPTQGTGSRPLRKGGPVPKRHHLPI